MRPSPSAIWRARRGHNAVAPRHLHLGFGGLVAPVSGNCELALRAVPRSGAVHVETDVGIVAFESARGGDAERVRAHLAVEVQIR